MQDGSGRVVGRYVLHDEIASGGMASIHIGRLQGPVGFSRTVAIKRLHAHYAKDPEFVSMFLDEARLAARIQHPNVAATIDVIALGGELFLVMEYIQGETLSRLLRAVKEKRARLPQPIALGIVADALYGLHAAHEATTETGEPLAIVHRDVSPHNIMVGKDGVSRVLDFGIAKAASRMQTTRDGQVKGKLAYMAPEQLRRRRVDRRTDVFAAAIVLWEALTTHRLFAADDEGGTVTRILNDPIEPPSAFAPEIPKALDAIVLKGLERDPDARFQTAHEMASALERVMPLARPVELGTYVQQMAGDALAQRARRIAEIEGTSSQDTDVPVDTASGITEIPVERGDASQITSLSSASSPRPSVKRRNWVVLATATLVVAGLVGVAFTRHEHTVDAVHSAQGPAAVPSAPPPPPLSIGPSSEPAPSVEPAPTASTTHERPAAHVSHTPPAPKVTTSCNPPFVIDSAGVKHFKPQCL